MSSDNHNELAAKWQPFWEKNRVYYPKNEPGSKKFYNLMMFPYPSAEGLHVGNMYAFTGADVYGRYQRMHQFDVFEPIGLDGFGIHSENYAIKVGRHPKEHAKISEKHFYEQLLAVGNGFAWDSRLETYDPEYYRFTQWIFIQLYKAGLAYKGSAMVNWCPSCKTVLADEQVEAGRCERCKTEVVRREMSSWFFKITEYADRLLENIDKIDWPDKIKLAQRQWIGKSKGMSIDFPLINSKMTISVWTKYWETIFGATFIVVSPEYLQMHLSNVVSEASLEYAKEAIGRSVDERRVAREKSGADTGLFVLNQATNKKIPVWVADYVIDGVGTGAVMGVPAHDSRDCDFATKYHLDIVTVIENELNQKGESYEGDGPLTNSQQFNGLSAAKEGKQKIADWLEKEGFGRFETTYHLRDWGISRQRYWGAPIPMINCDKCGLQPVAEKDLPVILPDIDDFKPKGDGTSPLANAPDDWKNVVCPVCGGEAKRELEVCDTFLDSSWYFLRYPSLHSENSIVKRNGEDIELPWNLDVTKKWFPVDAYIGGAEHAVLHLLYARFVWMVLVDQGFLPEGTSDEPFPFLFSHGLIIKDGAKMSKSKGNVVVPDEYIEKYGADTLRCYLMFLGPYNQGGDFRDSGIEGMNRFLKRVAQLYTCDPHNLNKQDLEEIEYICHKTVKKVSGDIARFHYNTAISSIMQLVQTLRSKTSKESKFSGNYKEKVWSESLKSLLQLLAPFAPFLTEELWHEHGFAKVDSESIHLSIWPSFDESKIVESTVVIAVQVNGKLRGSIEVSVDDIGDKQAMIDLALADEKLDKWIESGVKESIYVEGKIINFVV